MYLNVRLQKKAMFQNACHKTNEYIAFAKTLNIQISFSRWGSELISKKHAFFISTCCFTHWLQNAIFRTSSLCYQLQMSSHEDYISQRLSTWPQYINELFCFIYWYILVHYMSIQDVYVFSHVQKLTPETIPQLVLQTTYMYITRQ